MSTTETHSLPVQTDTALADLYNAAQAQDQRIASYEVSLLHDAGAKFYYRGRRRVTDMKVAEAEVIVTEALAELDAWKASHVVTEADGWVRTDWKGYAGRIQPYSEDSARERIVKLADARAELARIEGEMETLEVIFAEHRWSRFFLVTSSQGHIHSSMSCSTCRPTTTYGWLPQLSGATEEAAVEAHGPALCSVCFSSAPVEWVGGKLTKAQAAKAAH